MFNIDVKGKKISNCIYNNVQLYLYSVQDLILESESNALYKVKAGDFYGLEISKEEIIKVYPQQSSGIMVLDYETLHNKLHNQIIYHRIDDKVLLCEIKPLLSLESARQYTIKGVSIRVVQCKNSLYIYFNGDFCGCINQNCDNIRFEKLDKFGVEYGLLYIGGNKKYLVFFTDNKILFCGQYLDYQIVSKYIQIYYHNPNIFNIGNLFKYDFDSKDIEFKLVCDRGLEQKIDNLQFDEISFVEAIKCKRYKYSYRKLSYELKADIDENVLKQYFPTFDNYYYLKNEKSFIELYNNKVVGVLHLISNDRVIEQIY